MLIKIPIYMEGSAQVLHQLGFSWKFLKGSSNVNQARAYGFLGLESISNIPGGRHGSAI
jgi:hypothetical protein